VVLDAALRQPYEGAPTLRPPPRLTGRIRTIDREHVQDHAWTGVMSATGANDREITAEEVSGR
jgi:hypothetical protein